MNKKKEPVLSPYMQAKEIVENFTVNQCVTLTPLVPNIRKYINLLSGEKVFVTKLMEDGTSMFVVRAK